MKKNVLDFITAITDGLIKMRYLVYLIIITILIISAVTSSI